MIKFGFTNCLFCLLAIPAAVFGDETVGPAVTEAYREAAGNLNREAGADLTMPRDEEAADRARLESRILDQTTWNTLDPGEQAGYLVAFADRTALEGDREEARVLYGILRSTDVAILRDWGTYMTSGIDFAEGLYEMAAVGYETVCESGTPADWREHACEMAGLAGRLDDLEKTGGEHDGHVTATP